MGTSTIRRRAASLVSLASLARARAPLSVRGCTCLAKVINQTSSDPPFVERSIVGWSMTCLAKRTFSLSHHLRGTLGGWGAGLELSFGHCVKKFELLYARLEEWSWKSWGSNDYLCTSKIKKWWEEPFPTWPYPAPSPLHSILHLGLRKLCFTLIRMSGHLHHAQKAEVKGCFLHRLHDGLLYRGIHWVWSRVHSSSISKSDRQNLKGWG